MSMQCWDGQAEIIVGGVHVKFQELDNTTTRIDISLIKKISLIPNIVTIVESHTNFFAFILIKKILDNKTTISVIMQI